MLETAYTVERLAPVEPLEVPGSTEPTPPTTPERDCQHSIKSAAAFIAGFSPPDYLVDGLLQRRFLYSLTGQTGAGKTALSLLLAASVARGLPVGNRNVERGRVLYLAGENPDDVCMRVIAMAEHQAFAIDSLTVDFVDDTRDLDQIEDRARREGRDNGGFALVLVDTAAAFFPGECENDNVAMGSYARRLRKLTTLPGGPTVLAACHPIKHATADNLLPRGGGAFLNEVDGNLTLAKADALSTLHWQGKFRGPEFEAMSFELRSATAEALRDSKGRYIPTVVARSLSEPEQRKKAADARSDEDAVLIALLNFEGTPTPTSLAEVLGWRLTTGGINKMRGKRVVDRLRKDRLITEDRGALTLSEKGSKAANRAKYNADTTGATYS